MDVCPQRVILALTIHLKTYTNKNQSMRACGIFLHLVACEVFPQLHCQCPKKRLFAAAKIISHSFRENMHDEGLTEEDDGW